jgi:hypothetical protein
VAQTITITDVFNQSNGRFAGTEPVDLADGSEVAYNPVTSVPVQFAATSLGLDETGGLLWRGVYDARSIPAALTGYPEMAHRVRLYRMRPTRVRVISSEATSLPCLHSRSCCWKSA